MIHTRSLLNLYLWSVILLRKEKRKGEVDQKMESDRRKGGSIWANRGISSSGMVSRRMSMHCSRNILILQIYCK